MTNAVSSEQDTFEFPVRRAVIASSLRVILHTTVLVAIVLTSLEISVVVSILAGLAFGAVASRRSQRICLILTKEGMLVRNYFKTYFVESVEGNTLHFYLRNRTELEFSKKGRVYIQAATYFSDEERDLLESEMASRGAKIEHTTLGQ